MSNLSNWWQRLGLQFKLQILIQGFFGIALVVGQQWLTYRFEQQIVSSVEARATTTADGAIGGLNTLMVLKSALMATSKSPTYGQSNSPRQDG
jgi:hypothetical protein